jgi:hypothetical protein
MINVDPNHHKAAALLKHWIDQAPGAFSVRELGMAKMDEQDEFMLIWHLTNMVDNGFLEHYGNKRGWYVKVESELVELDYKSATPEPVDMWLPFGLSDLVEIHPGNIIIIAGTPNAGKSAAIYNTIKENKHKGWEQYLFNSESGAGELRKRLDKFPDMTMDMWDFRAYQRSEDFHQVVKSGENVINYIDFLQIHDDFYRIGGLLTRIHDKLDGAICIVGLQKNPGSETGLGGYRMLEVTRLAIALEFGKVKIIKAKNFRDPENNPNGKYKNFSLIDGCVIKSPHNWYREEQNG